MQFRTIDDDRSMRRPAIETESLARLDDDLDHDFEYGERLLDGIDWSGGVGDGILEESVVNDADLSGAVLSPFAIVDTVIGRSEISNGRWERVTARRLEITDCRLVGWQAQFSLVTDLYIADCRTDFAGISIGTAKGPIVFERCRFASASFLGDLSRAIFIDCTFRDADFSRVSDARGCDLRRSDLAGVNGLLSLSGALITAEQAVDISGELAVAAGFTLA
ncbi:pentapeptide repeat-containing protein [Glycomyces xiaoerkulensis]|uniref:pentapeptide repeat-containing protein n=1 Tax=Glycomyces xiaoerkulensis TaxID=2038139 RepID=UPI000C258B2C|nr:pentapeptide repeat-containing protein [Glycomyces xiaoerkulensis]